jgi:hypothetical protein
MPTGTATGRVALWDSSLPPGVIEGLTSIGFLASSSSWRARGLPRRQKRSHTEAAPAATA